MSGSPGARSVFWFEFALPYWGLMGLRCALPGTRFGAGAWPVDALLGEKAPETFRPLCVRKRASARMRRKRRVRRSLERRRSLHFGPRVGPPAG